MNRACTSVFPSCSRNASVVRKRRVGWEKSPSPRSSAEAGPMRSRGESNIRIVSEEQAYALASAALDYGAETDREGRAGRLASGRSARDWRWAPQAGELDGSFLPTVCSWHSPADYWGS